MTERIAKSKPYAKGDQRHRFHPVGLSMEGISRCSCGAEMMQLGEGRRKYSAAGASNWTSKAPAHVAASPAPEQPEQPSAEAQS